MWTIRIARGMLWISCGGSVILASTMLAGWPDGAASVLARFSSADLAEIAGKLPDWWHAAAGVLTGAGAFFARRHHQLDKRLNRTWHWVAYALAGNRTVRLERGSLTISGIDKYRGLDPASVISGRTAESFFAPEEAGRDFTAQDILPGEKANKTLYYEWQYPNGGESGVSRLTYWLGPPEGFWAKLLRRRTCRLSGRFFLEDGLATGTIDYFASEPEAAEAYDRRARPLRGAATPA
jgi:hypothetical protein